MEPEASRRALGAIVRKEAGLVLASLIARFGDFDLAEDAFQDAVAAALERWPHEGVPERPAAWLAVAARRRALDRLRHLAVRAQKAEALRAGEELRRRESASAEEGESVPDERLRLLFTCCHPALSPEARVALTLRTLGGLSTEAVARAFLLPVATLAKRLERAKGKIRDARIPYRVPPETEWTSRLDSVLAVLYLIFNEGYSASAAEPAARRALCEEAIRLARMLAALLPREGEACALLALMLLHDARRDARFGPDGALVPLDEQDRARWRRGELSEGLAALRAAAACPGRGPYRIQAAIAAAHVLAPSGAETPWPTIAALYAELESLAPSPVVRVNRAVAESRAHGAEAGLLLLAALERGDAARRLAAYPPYHAARADLLRRAGRSADAAAAYRAALALTPAGPDHRFLSTRLAQIRSLLPGSRNAGSSPARAARRPGATGPGGDAAEAPGSVRDRRAPPRPEPGASPTGVIPAKPPPAPHASPPREPEQRLRPAQAPTPFFRATAHPEGSRCAGRGRFLLSAARQSPGSHGMAKKSQVLRDQGRAKLIAKYKDRRAELRRRLQDPNLSMEEKFEVQEAFAKLPRNSCPTRITRRCRITGRSHAVYRKFGVSRIMLRELTLKGELPGMRKSSW